MSIVEVDHIFPAIVGNGIKNSLVQIRRLDPGHEVNFPVLHLTEKNNI